ncbi:hypothetical protein AMTR_s00005p00257760 [Amborella trichopoda]|uniref:Uncharacterized protein n=1 Tax=Amborella trichopoda TaxID=13333 RepID=W1PG26_AMBTC|nr:hypothetical protein AMTR_s00005p00257760 [Amborella trichopoda]
MGGVSKGREKEAVVRQRGRGARVGGGAYAVASGSRGRFFLTFFSPVTIGGREIADEERGING